MGIHSPVLIFFTHIPDNLDVANSLKRLASWSSWTIIRYNYLNDLPSLDPELYRHLIFLKHYEGDTSKLELYFVIVNNEYGEQTEAELLPGGKSIRVTNENVITFIHLISNHRLNSQIRQQSSHFMRGFQQLIEKDWIGMFNEHELQGKASRTLSWWCFNPGIAMEEFSQLGVGSIILTSGTLSPMDSFAQEFKLEFPVRLENPHVISANQIWAGVVSAGPSSYSFNSSYRSRDSVEYNLELGNAIGI
ncbi:unnamed protein product [Camellia sinensis]